MHRLLLVFISLMVKAADFRFGYFGIILNSYIHMPSLISTKCVHEFFNSLYNLLFVVFSFYFLKFILCQILIQNTYSDVFTC